MGGLSLVVLAASTREGLAARAAVMANDVRALADRAVHLVDVELDDPPRTLWRAVALGRDHTELDQALRALSTLGEAPGLIWGQVGTTTVGYVYSGTGNQWSGMARDLASVPGPFRRTLQDCDNALSAISDISVVDLLHRDAEAYPTVAEVQPLLVSVHIALTGLLTVLGVRPTAVLGHSMGEISAAYGAGVLSLVDTMRVVQACSAATAAHASGKGGMLAVRFDDELVTPEDLIRPGVELAAINGPRSAVYSGDPASLARMKQDARARGWKARVLDIDYAAHSQDMEPIGPTFSGTCTTSACGRRHSASTRR